MRGAVRGVLVGGCAVRGVLGVRCQGGVSWEGGSVRGC